MLNDPSLLQKAALIGADWIAAGEGAIAATIPATGETSGHVPCTRDLARAWKVGEQLENGMVGINTGLIPTAEAPFGGIKSSGPGREGSRNGIEEFVEIKHLCFGGIA